MVECGALEMRYTFTGIGGSTPPLSVHQSEILNFGLPWQGILGSNTLPLHEKEGTILTNINSLQLYTTLYCSVPEYNFTRISGVAE